MEFALLGSSISKFVNCYHLLCFGSVVLLSLRVGVVVCLTTLGFEYNNIDKAMLRYTQFSAKLHICQLRIFLGIKIHFLQAAINPHGSCIKM